MLDLDGQFVWLDDRSRKLFEFRLKENHGVNLFDLMIPLSRSRLKNKFGEAGLFGAQDPDPY